MTDITESNVTAIAEYDPVARGLAELEHRFSGVVFDVTTTKGLEEARAARRELVGLRTSLEDMRENLKAPVLRQGKLIDSEAKRIRIEIERLEDPIDADIKRAEAVKEAERQKRVQAEAERIAAVRRRIVQAFSVAPATARLTVAQLSEIRQHIEAEPVDESYGDLKIEAQETKVQTLAVLDERLVEARAYEAEQAELERQRAELAEQRRKDAAETEARRAAAEEERVRVNALADEQRRVQAEEMAQRQAQIDAQAADLARREAEVAQQTRAAREAEEQAARARRDEEDRKRLADQAALDAVQAAAPAMRAILADWSSLDRKAAHFDIEDLRRRRDDLLAALLAAQPERAPGTFTDADLGRRGYMPITR